MINKATISIILFSALFIGLTGCGDSTSVDEMEPPTVPEAVPAEINSTVFEDHNFSDSDYALFNEAKLLATTASAQINGGTALGQTYLDFTRSNESVFEDGVWTWTFTSTQSGLDVTVRTTAEELANGNQWNIFVNGSFNDQEVNDFQLLSGFISSDGESGNWRYFSPLSDDQPILEYQWEKTDDNQASFTTIFSDPDGQEQQTILYERDGADNTLTYDGFSMFADVVVYWNSDTGTGYIDREGEDRKCWDETFMETACS